MKIVPYTDAYRQAFIDFNTDWIMDNFGFLEREDLETFEKIDEELVTGAMIYTAIDDHGVPLAFCMTRPLKSDRWEICKLASNKHMPHRGAGSAVFKAAMDHAVRHGARELFLLSNRKLKPALHIYQKYGFHEIKLDDYEYERGDIAFIKEVERGCI